jgi:penicillin-binding protein 1B
LQFASVIIRTGTGDILSIIGGAGEEVGQFNHALDARRPIGSLVKPFIYLSALSVPLNYNLLTDVEDRDITLKLDNGQVWMPDNYDNTSHGTVRLYDALRHSYNLAAVHVGLDLGLDKVIATLHQSGINRKLSAFPSVLLGAVELTPLEVAQMYQTIANGGFQSPLNSISAVLDSDAKPLQRYGLQVKQSLDPRPVFLVNHALTMVVESGTARSLKDELGVKIPLAGKTGTTNDLRDSWFAGFGDNLLAVVWVGYDDNRPTRYTGASGALKVWAAMMKRTGITPVHLAAPEGINWLARHEGIIRLMCPDLPRLPYISGYVPKEQNACYYAEAQ